LKLALMLFETLWVVAFLVSFIFNVLPPIRRHAPVSVVLRVLWGGWGVTWTVGVVVGLLAALITGTVAPMTYGRAATPSERRVVISGANLPPAMEPLALRMRLYVGTRQASDDTVCISRYASLIPNIVVFSAPGESLAEVSSYCLRHELGHNASALWAFSPAFRADYEAAAAFMWEEPCRPWVGVVDRRCFGAFFIARFPGVFGNPLLGDWGGWIEAAADVFSYNLEWIPPPLDRWYAPWLQR